MTICYRFLCFVGRYHDHVLSSWYRFVITHWYIVLTDAYVAGDPNPARMSLLKGCYQLCLGRLQGTNKFPLVAETVPLMCPKYRIGLRPICIASTDSSFIRPSTSFQHCLTQHRTFATNANDPKDSIDTKEKKLTVFQRFTQVYKEYGKTLVVVHVVTSIMWYGGFYLIARRFV